jgi:hypothetical protein
MDPLRSLPVIWTRTFVSLHQIKVRWQVASDVLVSSEILASQILASEILVFSEVLMMKSWPLQIWFPEKS